MDKKADRGVSLLVDESTGRRLYDLLKTLYDAQYVGDIMPGSADPDVLEYAEKSGRVLVTDDKDFGELVFRLGRPNRGVILLRMPYEPEKRLRALSSLLGKIGVMDCKFVVLKQGEARIRTIEQ